jgi:hypothetical protein
LPRERREGKKREGGGKEWTKEGRRGRDDC